MMRYLGIIVVFLACFSLFGSDQSGQQEKFNFLTFKQLVSQKESNVRAFQAYRPSLVPFVDFKKTVDQFRYQQATKLVKAPWVNKNPFTRTASLRFIPFAQKMIVPTGSQVAFFGDLHGNIHALCALLNQLVKDGYLDANLRITKDNFYMIFLGDYVDRGIYGVEVIYLLLQLYLANPDHIILVRGNHEDQDLNQVMGFADELKAKFGPFSTQFVYQIYNYMPCVLYVGTKSGDFAQCCHGGLEAGFNAQQLLENEESIVYQSIQKIERKIAIQKLNPLLKLEIFKRIPASEINDFELVNPTMPITLGFLWHDFIEQGNDQIDYAWGRGWKYGKLITQQLLAQNSSDSARVCGVFRAHQHYGQMLEFLKNAQGIFSLWNGIVYTFLSAPIPGSDFPYASCGIVTVADSFSDWTLKHTVINL